MDPWAVTATAPAPTTPPPSAPPATNDPWAVASTAPAPTSTTPPSPTKPASSSLGDQWTAIKSLPHAFAQDHPVVTDVVKGGIKSAVQGGNQVLSWLDSIGKGVDEATDPLEIKPPAEHNAAEIAKQAEEKIAPGVTNAPNNTAQKTGGFLEQAAEFLYGEGEARTAFESLSMADKLQKVAKATKFLEEHPTIAKAVLSGLTQGGVGTAQSLVHGATPTEALETGAIAGTGGAVLEGAPGYLADEQSLTAKKVAAAAAHEASPAVQAERTAAMVEGQQTQAQGAVKDVAKKAASDAIERINAARTPKTEVVPGTPPRAGADTIEEGLRGQRARAQVGSTAATVPDRMLVKNPLVDELGSQSAAVPKRLFEGGAPATTRTVAGAFEPVDAEAVAQKVGSFGDAAESIRDASTPVYQKLDQVSGGKFADIQKQIKQAYGARDFAKVTAGEDAMDALLEMHKSDVSPEDYAAARSAWRDSKTLDQLHNAVEGSFNGITEDMAAQEGTGKRLLRTGNSEGGTLQKRLGAMLRKPGAADNVTRVIGPDGLTNLYRASELVSNPTLKAKTIEIAQAVAKEFPDPNAKDSPDWVKNIGRYSAAGLAGEVASHATGVSRSYTVPAAEATMYVLRQMVTNPRVGQLMEYAVKNGVTPQRAGALIAASISAEQNANKQENTQ